MGMGIEEDVREEFKWFCKKLHGRFEEDSGVMKCTFSPEWWQEVHRMDFEEERVEVTYNPVEDGEDFWMQDFWIPVKEVIVQKENTPVHARGKVSIPVSDHFWEGYYIREIEYDTKEERMKLKIEKRPKKRYWDFSSILTWRKGVHLRRRT